MSYPVVIPYDPAWRPLEWAIINCPSYITNEGVVKHPNGTGVGIRYFFGKAEDAAYFKLTWA